MSALWKKLGLLGAIAVLAGLGVLVWGRWNEPQPGGRPLRAWMEDLYSRDVSVRERALDTLCTLGRPAVPRLRAQLRRRDTLWDSAMGMLQMQGPEPVRRWLENRASASQVRATAAWVLRRMGPEAGEATPELLRALDDRETSVARLAEYALGAIGEPALPGLCEAVESRGRARRLAALRLIRQLGSSAVSARPVVVRALQDSDLEIRLAAAEALWRMGGEQGRVIQVLVGLAGSTNATLQLGAVKALGTMGSAAVEAVPCLETCVDASNPYVRMQAGEALARVVGRTNVAITTYRKALRHPDTNVRWEALTGLGRWIPASRSALADVITAAADGDRYVRSAAVTLLGAMGEDARAALPALRVAARDTDTLVQSNAAESLCKIDPQNNPAPRAME